MLALLFSNVRPVFISMGALSVYALLNSYFLMKTNYYWKRSAYIVNRLTHEIPDPANRTIILLNLPENMNGILMVGSQPESVWKLIYNLNNEKQINNPVYDVASYNMLTPDDGAHVKVLNDSTLSVTLNQWGTWWWYRYRGGISYENDAYKLNMKDVGHSYELTIRKAPSEYLLLYSVGDKWKQVDWNKKDIDQY